MIDPVSDYQELMAGLFDFERIRALFASGFRIRFDAMSAVTGPYARAILERHARRAARLGDERRSRARTSAATIPTPTRPMRPS